MFSIVNVAIFNNYVSHHMSLPEGSVLPPLRIAAAEEWSETLAPDRGLPKLSL